MRKVVIASPVATQSGYGHHAREIITNMIEQRGTEWDIKLVSLPWGHTPMTYPISTDLQLRIIPLPLQEQPEQPLRGQPISSISSSERPFVIA